MKVCMSVEAVAGLSESDMSGAGDDPTMSLFLFQDYQQYFNTAFLKAEIQKILFLPEHETWELQNSSTESWPWIFSQ